MIEKHMTREQDKKMARTTLKSAKPTMGSLKKRKHET
jgi:hypothetical protein